MRLRPTRYTARWVLPVTAPPVADGAVLVDATGRIADTGPAAAVAAPENALAIDLGNAILLPGLVNTHAHLELSVFRGFLEDLPFPDWIARLLEAKRLTPFAPEDALAAARWSCIEAISAGITTIACTEDSAGGLLALVECGLRGIVFREVFGPDPVLGDDVIEAARPELGRLRDQATDLVRVGLSPHAPYSVSDKLFAAAARFAMDEGLPLAVHIAESRDETELVTRGSGIFADRLRARGFATPVRGRSPIDLLARTGVLEARPLLIHATQVDAADIAEIAAAGAAVAHCPVANARLGHGTAPVPELREVGVTVGIGTDSVASNNRMDVLEEARLAQLLQRARGRPGALPADALLRMVTIEGARALGLDAVTGSLEPGKDADLCAVRLGTPHTEPVHDPLAALFHSARGSDVILTAVRGRVLCRDGQFLTADADQARDAALEVAARIRAAGTRRAPAAGAMQSVS